MSILIKEARVICPLSGLDKVQDLLVLEGLISAIDEPGKIGVGSDRKLREINAKGQVLAPGLVDIHVHLREPGYEWKEDILSGSKAAVKGGFTEVCCMPNTDPVNDNAQVTDYILKQAKQANLLKVRPIGAVSMKLEGESLAPLNELWEVGCVAFSDDGFPVWNAALMRRALEHCKQLNAVITCHEEDKSLSDGFSMNESELSLKLGLKGMPEAAENVMIARDIELARLTGARVHFCHVSTKRGAQLIERAKDDGIPVTAETTPHYLSLTESELEAYSTNSKMSMPLRKEADVEGLIEALNSGVIDCIASDHAPHERESKEVEFDRASFGIIGLETSLPVSLSLVRAGKVSLGRMIESMTSSARKSLNLPSQSITVGQPADLTLIDLEAEEKFSKESILSKGKNSPYLGQTLKGLATLTIVDGRIVFERGVNNEG